MDDEEFVELEYKDGYNDGYLLHKADKALADEYIRRRKMEPIINPSERDKGMKDGILQGRIEDMQKDLDDIFEEKKNRKRGLSH